MVYLHKLCKKPALILSFLFLFLSPLGADDHAYFTPPKKWLLADPKLYSPSVQICCIPKKTTGFSPSINFAIEEDVTSLNEYVETIQTIHLEEKKKRWRNLGTIVSNSGEGILTEIDTTSGGREIRLLQCIFVQNNTAYILTAAARKKEMSSYYAPFLESFKSFTITKNLLESIPEKMRQTALQTKLSELNQRQREKGFEKSVWKPFEQKFAKEFSDMGAHWQILMLKKIRETYEKTSH